jgi:hypothetical protein
VSAVVELLRAAAVLAVVALAPGEALLRLLRVPAGAPLVRLALGACLGVFVAGCGFLAERALGLPVVVLPCALVALVAVRPSASTLRALRSLSPELALPAALALVALAANAGDWRLGPEGARLRLGFDVGDRVYYALVSQELQRAPLTAVENPAFGGLPLSYSLLPPALAGLLSTYAGIDAVACCVRVLPALGVFLVGLCASALCVELGAPRLAARLLPLLLVLGGDLSFLVAGRNLTFLERTRHFAVFQSFGAEALLYNPWFLGLPLLLALLVVVGRHARDGGRPYLALAALLGSALFASKAFAVLGLLAGVGLAALLFRSRRLAAGGVAIAAGALPWALLALAASAGREGAPLALGGDLLLVRMALQANPALATLARGLGYAAGSLAGAPLAALAVTLAFLVGGFGVRLVGLWRFWSDARADRSGAAAVPALTCAASVVAALVVVGNPMPAEGLQFLMLAQYLAWLPAALVLSRWLEDGGGRQRALAGVLVVLALVTPVGALARKLAPEALTPERSIDRAVLALTSEDLDAARALRRLSPRGALVAVPLGGDARDPGGALPLLVGALAERRIVAALAEFHAGPRAAASRQAALERLYATSDGDEARSILRGLGVRWLWEDVARPLRFPTAGFASRWEAPSVRLLELSELP